MIEKKKKLAFWVPVCSNTMLLLTVDKISWLSDEYGIDTFKTILRKVVQDLNSLSSLTAERRQICYLHDHKRPYSHTRKLESRNGIVSKTTSIFPNSLATCETTRIITMTIMTLANIDTVSQTGVLSTVWSIQKLYVGMALRCLFKGILALHTSRWWLHSCFLESFRMHLTILHLTSL